ncbi:MAG: ATP-binding protein [Nocardioides sp.]
MQPNPYAPGGRPEYLAGRGRQREIIRERLARLSTLGRSGGPLLAFHAPRGLGKTSLLRQAQRDALAEGFLTVWATGRDDAPMAPGLAQSLTTAIEERSFGERAKGLLHSLDKVQVELGVPGAKVGAEISTTRESAAIETVLEDAGKFARNHDAQGLAVFIDEFQDVRLSDRKSLLIALQHFDGDPTGCPVAVVAAGLPSLPEAVTEAATFGERTHFVELGPLTEVAVAEALRLPAEQLGVSWSDDAVVAAIDLAAGYPHKVQLVGQSTWEIARPEVGHAISAGQVAAAAEETDRRMADLFRTRLARATPEQRRIIDAMAALGGSGADRAALAAALGIDSSALSRPRQELIDKGLVAASGRGRLEFTIPGFDHYVRSQLEAPALPRWASTGESAHPAPPPPTKPSGTDRTGAPPDRSSGR